MEVPEAANAINAREAADGVLVHVNLPANAQAGDVVTASIDGSAPVRHVVTSAEVLRGVAEITLSAADVAAAGQGPASVVATYATATGVAAANSPVSSDVLIDTIAPATPSAPSSYVDDVGMTQSANSTAALTDDNRPGLNIGAVPAGMTPKLYVDGVAVAATYDAASGSLTPNQPVADGQHAFSITLSDAAGNESQPGPALTLRIDATPPTQPVITTVQDNAQPDTGAVPNGGRTNDTTPTLVGTADPDSRITIRDGTVVRGTTTADAQGNWTFTPQALPLNGAHSFSATAEDAAGNQSQPSEAYRVTIDQLAPLAPVLGVVGLSDSGVSQTDNVSNVATPQLLVTLQSAGDNVPLVGDVVRIFSTSMLPATAGQASGDGMSAQASGVQELVASAVLSAADVSAGKVVLQTSSLITDGTKNFTATVTDAAGNTSESSNQVNYVLDSVGPKAAINVVNTALGTVLGVVQSTPVQINFSEVVAGFGLEDLSVTGGALSNLQQSALDPKSYTATLTPGLNLNTVGNLIALTAAGFTDTAGNAGSGAVSNPFSVSTLLGLGGILGEADLTSSDGGAMLYGGAGNDLLNFSPDAASIDGGAGFDILRVDTDRVNFSGNAHEVTNMEGIDLGAGPASRAVSLAIDEAGVLKLTGGGNVLQVTGDSADTVLLGPANFVRQEVLDGHTFNVYTLGSSAIKIEDPIVVVT